ncbi:MAG: hypothetical protein ACOX9E_11045 [Lentisphaeria bacterium]
MDKVDKQLFPVRLAEPSVPVFRLCCGLAARSVTRFRITLRRRRLTMLNPSLQAGVRTPHEAVPCKGTTAEKDHRHDWYQSVTAYRVPAKRAPGILLFVCKIAILIIFSAIAS